MASSQNSFIPSASNPTFDEQRWVAHVRYSLEKEVEEEDVKVPVSVFTVPKPLLCNKPEAYTPQLFALGPYHHWQPELYEMERYKLATAKRTKRDLRSIKLHELVQQMIKHEHKIRSHYHRYLDVTPETLAWMMTIDASFLLEFLRNYSDVGDGNKVPSMSHMVDGAKMKLAYNVIIRDIVMLENQIPLYLVRKILRNQVESAEVATVEFSKMLVGFVKDVSPFKSIKNLPSCIIAKQYAHLLQLLYCTVVPRDKGECLEIEINYHADAPKEGEEGAEKAADPSYVRRLFNSAWEQASSLNGAVVEFIKRVLNARPLQFLVKVPWKIISSLPIISILKGPIESLFFNGEEKEKDEDAGSSNASKPPSVEEIMIPSVTELTRAGVKFSPVNGDITTIKFVVKTATFYLPKVSLDVNTEVLLRNLVAYETSVELGPMVFTRYTELMNGIIDTEEDVKLLRESGIVVNRMKSDEEVANLWNGMSKSVRLSRVGFIDKVLEDVNKYYNSRWSVKSMKFMRKYVFGSWQFLVFLAAIALLILSCVQAFCSVYTCGARWITVDTTNTTTEGS